MCIRDRKTVILSWEIPPTLIAIGVNFLFICAGRDIACATVTGLKTSELIRMQISKNVLNDLDNIISPPVDLRC